MHARRSRLFLVIAAGQLARSTLPAANRTDRLAAPPARRRCDRLQDKHAGNPSHLSCSGLLRESWGHGGAELARACASNRKLRSQCAFLCCCTELAEMPPASHDRDWLPDYERCVARLSLQPHTHSCLDLERSSPVEQHAAGGRAAAPDWTAEWKKARVVRKVGYGEKGRVDLVQFANGFRCMRKTFFKLGATPAARREVRLQSQAAAAGAAPHILHFVKGVPNGSHSSTIFSEILVPAWTNMSCVGREQRAHVIRTCDELGRAMFALDRAGILHGDLKMGHIMRTQAGALAIIDYTAAKQYKGAPGHAGANNGSCMTGANHISFVGDNACFHTDATRTAGMPSADEADGREHRLADSVFQAQASGFRYVHDVPRKKWHEPEDCFAWLCFPRLARAARRAQRQRFVQFDVEALNQCPHLSKRGTENKRPKTAVEASRSGTGSSRHIKKT